jgi:hypothetical protein
VIDRVFMLDVRPWRIDVLTGIDGVTFEEAMGISDRRRFSPDRSFCHWPRCAPVKQTRRRAKKDLVDVALLDQAPGRRD